MLPDALAKEILQSASQSTVILQRYGLSTWGRRSSSGTDIALRTLALALLRAKPQEDGGAEDEARKPDRAHRRQPSPGTEGSE